MARTCCLSTEQKMRIPDPANTHFWGWGDGSVVKIIGRPFRGHKLDSQHLHSSSLLTSMGTRHVCGAHEGMQARHSHA